MSRIMIFLNIIFTLLVIACGETETYISQSNIRNGKEVTFSASIVSDMQTTKATDIALEEGDMIGIYVVKRSNPNISGILQSSGNFADNKIYTIHNGLLTPNTYTDKIYLAADDVYDFYAFSPYQNIQNTQHPFSVATNQSIKSSHQASDLKQAKVLNVKGSDKNVNLVFQHLMALIELRFKKESDFTVKDVNLSLCKNKAEVNIQTGEIANLNSVTPIQMYLYGETESNYIYRAIVPEQAILANQQIFRVKRDNNSEMVYVSNDNNFFLKGGTKKVYPFGAQYWCHVCCNQTDWGSVSWNKAIFSHGDIVTVIAIPNYGYEFQGWYENNILVSSSSEYSFNVTADRNLVAKFNPETFQIEINSNSGSWSSGKVQGNGFYNYGSQCTIKAIPAEYCRFLGWYENEVLISTDMDYTFTVSCDRSFYAKFDRALGFGKTEDRIHLSHYDITSRTDNPGLQNKYLEAGTRIQSNVFMGYEEIGGSHYHPYSVSYTLEITCGNEIVSTSSHPENYSFVVPKDGYYYFNYYMNFSGQFDESETVIIWGTWHYFIWKN